MIFWKGPQILIYKTFFSYYFSPKRLSAFIKTFSIKSIKMHSPLYKYKILEDCCGQLLHLKILNEITVRTYTARKILFKEPAACNLCHRFAMHNRKYGSSLLLATLAWTLFRLLPPVASIIISDKALAWCWPSSPEWSPTIHVVISSSLRHFWKPLKLPKLSKSGEQFEVFKVRSD